MDEHPDDAVDVLDELSHDVKQGAFKGVQTPLRNTSLPSAAELLAEKQRLLFTATDDPVQETEMVSLLDLHSVCEMTPVSSGLWVCLLESRWGQFFRI